MGNTYMYKKSLANDFNLTEFYDANLSFCVCMCDVPGGSAIKSCYKIRERQPKRTCAMWQNYPSLESLYCTVQNVPFVRHIIQLTLNRDSR